MKTLLVVSLFITAQLALALEVKVIKGINFGQNKQSSDQRIVSLEDDERGEVLVKGQPGQWIWIRNLNKKINLSNNSTNKKLKVEEIVHSPNQRFFKLNSYGETLLTFGATRSSYNNYPTGKYRGSIKLSINTFNFSTRLEIPVKQVITSDANLSVHIIKGVAFPTAIQGDQYYILPASGPDSQTGIIEISGQAHQKITIETISPSLQMKTSPGNDQNSKIKVTDINIYPTGTIQLDQNGLAKIKIGATRTDIFAGQLTGTYSGALGLLFYTNPGNASRVDLSFDTTIITDISITNETDMVFNKSCPTKKETLKATVQLRVNGEPNTNFDMFYPSNFKLWNRTQDHFIEVQTQGPHFGLLDENGQAIERITGIIDINENTPLGYYTGSGYVDTIYSLFASEYFHAEIQVQCN